MRFANRTYSTLIAIALLATGCYDAHTAPAAEPTIEPATTTIGSLRTICNGQSLDITTDAVVVGRITTSDRADNFHRSFFVEDSTGSIEVMAGEYDLWRKYPQGTDISIALNHCRIGFSDGAMQVGLRPESYSYHEVAYFMSDVLMDKHIRRGNDRTEAVPNTMTIATLCDEWCGRLVRICELTHSPDTASDEPTVKAQMGGYNRFTDPAGNAVHTFVREGASFATKPLPTHEVAICGILLYANVPDAGRQYIIKPRSSDDYETPRDRR